MCRFPFQLLLFLAVSLFLAGIFFHHPLAAPPIYWCPDRPPDQQYRATPDPGCTPFVNKKNSRDSQSTSTSDKPRSIDLNNLQGEVSDFLQRYNEYLACCATDPTTLEDIKALEAHANDLLETIQMGMSGEQVKIRGMTFHQMLQPVSQATDNLGQLRERLERIGESMDRLPGLGYEETGIAKRKIQEEQEAISRSYQPIELHGSGRTGTGIHDSTLPTRIGDGGGTQPSTSLPTRTGDPMNGAARTGPDIGEASSSGTDIGQTPATGFGIGGNDRPSSLPSRAGPNIGK